MRWSGGSHQISFWGLTLLGCHSVLVLHHLSPSTGEKLVTVRILLRGESFYFLKSEVKSPVP